MLAIFRHQSDASRNRRAHVANPQGHAVNGDAASVWAVSAKNSRRHFAATGANQTIQINIDNWFEENR